jgi:8-oxo-dGTP diphosphatase
VLASSPAALKAPDATIVTAHRKQAAHTLAARQRPQRGDSDGSNHQSREGLAVTSRARHCLACGTRLRTTRQEGLQRRRCPQCGWTFYDNPAPAAVAIIEGRGGILLARRAAPPYRDTWDLPGGFLEAGELPDRALVRELREELRARAALIRVHGFSIDRYGAGGIPVLAMVYVVRLAGRPSARSDVAEVRWFRRDAIPWRQIGFPSIKRSLHEYLRQRAARGAVKRRRASLSGRR